MHKGFGGNRFLTNACRLPDGTQLVVAFRCVSGACGATELQQEEGRLNR